MSTTVLRALGAIIAALALSITTVLSWKLLSQNDGPGQFHRFDALTLVISASLLSFALTSTPLRERQHLGHWVIGAIVTLAFPLVVVVSSAYLCSVTYWGLGDLERGWRDAWRILDPSGRNPIVWRWCYDHGPVVLILGWSAGFGRELVARSRRGIPSLAALSFCIAMVACCATHFLLGPMQIGHTGVVVPSFASSSFVAPEPQAADVLRRRLVTVLGRSGSLACVLPLLMHAVMVGVSRWTVPGSVSLPHPEQT